jgi:hypothetical protein
MITDFKFERAAEGTVDRDILSCQEGVILGKFEI